MPIAVARGTPSKRVATPARAIGRTMLALATVDEPTDHEERAVHDEDAADTGDDEAAEGEHHDPLPPIGIAQHAPDEERPGCHDGREHQERLDLGSLADGRLDRREARREDAWGEAGGDQRETGSDQRLDGARFAGQIGQEGRDRWPSHRWMLVGRLSSVPVQTAARRTVDHVPAEFRQLIADGICTSRSPWRLGRRHEPRAGRRPPRGPGRPARPRRSRPPTRGRGRARARGRHRG